MGIALTLARHFARVVAMDATVEQMELLAGFPVERVRRRSILREVAEVFERHGPVVPQHMVCKLLGVSRQRVGKLIQEGRIGVVTIGGRQYVPYEALRYFLADERKNGRPYKCASAYVKVAEKSR